MKALVLGGGSMKGAYQVGAIKAVLEAGFEPEMIYGVSVGALNSTFLSHEAGISFKENKPIKWDEVGRKLMAFWLRHITSPANVGVLRNKMTIGYDALTKQYEGLLDPTPLHSLVASKIDLPTLQASPIKTKVGSVNALTGAMVYTSKEDNEFLNYVYASSSIPIIMPGVEIGPDKVLHLDGAMREVTPIRQVIVDGATEIVSISCHSSMIYHRETYNPKSLISLIEKVRDITVNQLVNNDIVWAENYAERASLRNENFKLTIIRPQTPLLLDMAHFNSNDISKLIVQGYKDAIEVLKKN